MFRLTDRRDMTLAESDEKPPNTNTCLRSVKGILLDICLHFDEDVGCIKISTAILNDFSPSLPITKFISFDVILLAIHLKKEQYVLVVELECINVGSKVVG